MVKCRDVIERVFCYLDEDGDGKISFEELGRCLAAVRGDNEAVVVDDDDDDDQEVLEAMVKSFDSDGDGLLGLEDFVGLLEGEGEGEEEEKVMKELREAFEMYVMDGYEYITPMSLRRMLSQLGESKTIDECRVMINQFDLNGDGVLNFDEFRIMILL
ncbi:EF-hand domain [Macleaya cordata]|uniref:EF-hand domain n=1 Tax=Macleaya cordata TaxID=56857 RepID=A0A200QG94_MACCD|nr:EF-hand domain [Macleaya cordata]